MKKIIILFMAFSFILAGCTPAEQTDAPSSETPETSSAAFSEAAAPAKEEDTSSSSSSSEPEPAPETALAEEEAKKLLAASQEQYPEAVAWLNIPGTYISDYVMQGEDNNTYYRRILNGAEEECIFMDYESLLGDGTPSGISQNTIIYGMNYGTWPDVAEGDDWLDEYKQHRKEQKSSAELSFDMQRAIERLTEDDPDGPSFSQLLRFADADFAKGHPYLYLTTPAQTLVFEIFMAGYVDPYTDPSYFYAEYSDEDFTRLAQVMREYSLYHYSREVTPSDRLLTLSTDTFHFPNMVGKYDQRAKFVVMAALIGEGESLKESADLQPNPSPKQPTLHPFLFSDND